MDLDAFAAKEGYRPKPGGVRVSQLDTLDPKLAAKIVDGRRAGYAWSFLTRWLKTEYDIDVGRETLRDYFTTRNPETR